MESVQQSINLNKFRFNVDTQTKSLKNDLAYMSEKISKVLKELPEFLFTAMGVVADSLALAPSFSHSVCVAEGLERMHVASDIVETEGTESTFVPEGIADLHDRVIANLINTLKIVPITLGIAAVLVVKQIATEYRPAAEFFASAARIGGNQVYEGLQFIVGPVVENVVYGLLGPLFIAIKTSALAKSIFLMGKLVVSRGKEEFREAITKKMLMVRTVDIASQAVILTVAILALASLSNPFTLGFSILAVSIGVLCLAYDKYSDKYEQFSITIGEKEIMVDHPAKYKGRDIEKSILAAKCVAMEIEQEVQDAVDQYRALLIKNKYSYSSDEYSEGLQEVAEIAEEAANKLTTERFQRGQRFVDEDIDRQVEMFARGYIEMRKRMVEGSLNVSETTYTYNEQILDISGWNPFSPFTLKIAPKSWNIYQEQKDAMMNSDDSQSPKPTMIDRTRDTIAQMVNSLKRTKVAMA